MGNDKRTVRVPCLPRTVRWAVALVVAVCITVASVVETGGVSRGPLTDTHLHLGAYAVFSVVLAYATLHYRERSLARVAIVLSGAVALGAGLELVQLTLPYRTFSLGDLFANSAGAFVGLVWVALEPHVRYVEPPLIGE
jgi:VanZ family protein